MTKQEGATVARAETRWEGAGGGEVGFVGWDQIVNMTAGL